MLVDAGLSPRQALAAATSNVGDTFGWPVGYLKEGCEADFLILEADPSTDIAHLQEIRHVVLQGITMDRETLLKRP